MAIQCEICDSTNLLKQDGVFVCQDCGARYTTEEIKKMVSGASSTSVPPTPSVTAATTPVAKKEAPASEAQRPTKDEELTQLLEWSRSAYAEGNTVAGDTYLSKANNKDCTNPDVIQMNLERGKIYSRDNLKHLIEKSAVSYEFAYDVLEKQGMTLGFPFAESDYERLKGKSGTASRLVERTIPELKMEGFWDIDRLLAIHFKSAIRWMNAYQLPEPTTEDGLSAASHWGIVLGIFNTDKYLQEVDMLIPSSLKIDLYKAFCKACDTVLQGTFYIQVHVGYQSFDYPKITEDLTVKLYHATNRTQPLEAQRWKEAKEVREKYKNLIAKIEADAAAAIAAEKAKRNAAYWEEHLEKYSQLKSEKTLLEAKIRKLQNEHQADPQKKAMEAARRDIIKYNYELQSCGIFQGKRKKELAEWIAVLQKKERECAATYEKNTADYEESLKDLQNQLTEVSKRLNRE